MGVRETSGSDCCAIWGEGAVVQPVRTTSVKKKSDRTLCEAGPLSLSVILFPEIARFQKMIAKINQY